MIAILPSLRYSLLLASSSPRVASSPDLSSSPSSPRVSSLLSNVSAARRREHLFSPVFLAVANVPVWPSFLRLHLCSTAWPSLHCISSEFIKFEFYLFLVNNRDMSVAVLRTFISRCMEEHEANFPKKAKIAPKISESDASEPANEDVPHASPPEDCRDNGECEDGNGMDLDKSCNTGEGQVKSIEECNWAGESMSNADGKVQRELKPPRVLEALSASELRALRYAHEIEGIGHVVALDNDEDDSRILHYTPAGQ
ncbi:uncharacterized protein LOC110278254 [Arachis duranensis]|uniref:tRNA (guanine(26)-N(2))-dimethyltransferase n=1 Tax=Arachis duranensis TaxID=130453 RepID=A0A6P5N5T0_ARADU|nr:uncharacterized protein LOC110278254 [Arachis duranensis]